MRFIALWPLLVAVTANGQDTFSVGTVAARPGQESIIVPIRASTSGDLTGLEGRIEFDPALCAILRSSELRRTRRTDLRQQGRRSPECSGIDPTRARTIVDDEEAFGCPARGQLRVIADDFCGDVVIPAGDGPIFEWRIGVAPQAVPESFQVSIVIDQARNGQEVRATRTQTGSLNVTTCFGDCDGDGVTNTSDLVRGVRVALGSEETSCFPADEDGDGALEIGELITAVRTSMQGCSE